MNGKLAAVIVGSLVSLLAFFFIGWADLRTGQARLIAEVEALNAKIVMIENTREREQIELRRRLDRLEDFHPHPRRTR